MTRIKDLHAGWMKDDPAYAAEYDALAAEFELAQSELWDAGKPKR